MYTPHMIEHVLSQCRLVAQGKNIWEVEDQGWEEDWDCYQPAAEYEAWRSKEFSRDLLSLVAMGEDYPDDEDGGVGRDGLEGGDP